LVTDVTGFVDVMTRFWDQKVKVTALQAMTHCEHHMSKTNKSNFA